MLVQSEQISAPAANENPFAVAAQDIPSGTARKFWLPMAGKFAIVKPSGRSLVYYKAW